MVFPDRLPILVYIKKLIISYFARHTGKAEKTVAKDLERDYYMSAEEAKNYGIVDKVLIRGENGKSSEE